MTFKDVALSMWPYWALGAMMVLATISSGNKELVRIDKKALSKWSIFLAIMTLYRMATLPFLLKFPFFKHAAESCNIIPWQATLTVFWEDACHTLPLVLLRKAIGNTKWYSKAANLAAMAMVMLSFGSGHVYQGFFAAAMLMLYIPYTIKLGEKYGFGTIMIGHSLYDLSTILALKWALGSL